jgi:hypothetical protein
MVADGGVLRDCITRVSFCDIHLCTVAGYALRGRLRLLIDIGVIFFWSNTPKHGARHLVTTLAVAVCTGLATAVNTLASLAVTLNTLCSVASVEAAVCAATPANELLFGCRTARAFGPHSGSLGNRSTGEATWRSGAGIDGASSFVGAVQQENTELKADNPALFCTLPAPLRLARHVRTASLSLLS